MSEHIKKIVEGIDSKDIVAVVESFTPALKDRVLNLIKEQSVKAFDKKVDEIDGDGKSDADGEDTDDEGKKVDIDEAKIGKAEELNFGRQVDMNRAEKATPSKWSKDIYDAVVSKFGKNAGSITTFETVSGKSGAVDIHTGTKNKNAKHTSISLVGGYLKISVKTEFSNTAKTTYAKIA